MSTNEDYGEYHTMTSSLPILASGLLFLAGCSPSEAESKINTNNGSRQIDWERGSPLDYDTKTVDGSEVDRAWTAEVYGRRAVDRINTCMVLDGFRFGHKTYLPHNHTMGQIQETDNETGKERVTSINYKHLD